MRMSVIEGLLDSDSSIRWQVMRDLIAESDATVILWGLDYLRRAGFAPDERIAEAVDLVAKKRDENGRWPLENPHPGPVHFEMEGRAGEPSRWNILRALRVLRWASAL
jgi:hypothetical protein